MFKKSNNDKWLIATLCLQLIILLMAIANAIQLNNIDKQLDATLERMRTKSVLVGETSTSLDADKTPDGNIDTSAKPEATSDEVVLYDIRKPHESDIMWCSDSQGGICRTPYSAINMDNIIRMAYTKMFRFYGDRTEIPDDIKFDAQVDTTLDDDTYKAYVRTNYNGARITRVIEDKKNRRIHIYYADMNEDLYRAEVQLQKDKHNR